MSKSRAKGTRYESDVVEYLQTQGAPYAERRALGGIKDRGDITGIPGLILECKNQQRMELASWVDQSLEATTHHPAPAIPIVVHKRRGTHVRKSYATVQLDALCILLREAGYLEDIPKEAA